VVYSLALLYIVQNYPYKLIPVHRFSAQQIQVLFLFSVILTIVTIEFRDACDVLFPVLGMFMMVYTPIYKCVQFFFFPIDSFFPVDSEQTDGVSAYTSKD